MGVVVALALPVMASAEEVWVLPSDVTKTSVGTWATTADKSVYFSLAIPDDFDSFNRAVLLAVGTVHDAKEPILVDFIVDLSVSGHGLADDDYVDTAIIQATLTEGELTEIDISSLLAINYAPGVEYLSVRVEEDGPGNSQAFQLAGMRVAYTSTDGDTDPTNELNTNVQLNGTLLEVTDAGGTLSADLASLEESAEILAEEARALAAEALLQAAIDDHVAADQDLDETNELNTYIELVGTDLEITDAGGVLVADLSSLEESADILAEEMRALAAEAGLAADIAAEEARALAAEATLTADLSAEEARALAAEAALAAALAAEEARALAAEAANAADIAAEEARALAAEAVLAADLAAEESRALAAEAALAADLAAEEARALAAETALAADLATETARALAAEAALAADISGVATDVAAETARALAAEAGLQANIDAHVAADGDLDSTNELQTVSQVGDTVTLSDGGGAFSVADGDSDATNEIQVLSQVGLSVTLSNGGGAISVADNDNDAANELQTVSKVGDTVTLSNGGGAFSVADSDSDPTNELQSLSLLGNTLSLTDGGSVNLGSIGGDNLGNHNATQRVYMNGNDLDFEEGLLGQIRSVGQISFDWTNGTYDSASYHGLESQSEGGSWADEIRLNSYDDVTVTIDTNNNDTTSYFTVQHHSTGNGSDLFWVSSTGQVWGKHLSITDGATTSYDDDGSQDCPSSRVARGFDADDWLGTIDRIRLNCGYVR